MKPKPGAEFGFCLELLCIHGWFSICCFFYTKLSEPQIKRIYDFYAAFCCLMLCFPWFSGFSFYGVNMLLFFSSHEIKTWRRGEHVKRSKVFGLLLEIKYYIIVLYHEISTSYKFRQEKPQSKIWFPFPQF